MTLSQEGATGRASSQGHPPVPNSSPTSALTEGGREMEKDYLGGGHCAPGWADP